MKRTKMEDVHRAIKTAAAGAMERILFHTTGEEVQTDFPTSACFSVHVGTACIGMNDNFVRLSLEIQAVEMDLVTGAHLSGNRVVYQELVIVLQGGSKLNVCFSCATCHRLSVALIFTPFHAHRIERAEKTNTRNDMTQNVTMTNTHFLLNSIDDENHLHARNMSAATGFRATTCPTHTTRLANTPPTSQTSDTCDQVTAMMCAISNNVNLYSTSLALTFTWKVT